jgi:hypothetical protein
MEVHAHAHTARKKWTHYFWEFLMLFLAVFCGFLAEYQLEHKIEKSREKQFMAGLLEDLHMDTTTLQSVYELGTKQKYTIDSLLDVINNQALTADNIKKIYLLSSNSTRVIDVGFEERTSSQLKNSGAMRLIRNKRTSDTILRYWQDVNVSNKISDRLDFIASGRAELFARLFHNKYYIRGDGPLAPVTGIKDNALLISNDPALLAEYSNFTYFRKGVLNNYLSVMKITRDRALRLMEIIRKEYHLK